MPLNVTVNTKKRRKTFLISCSKYDTAQYYSTIPIIMVTILLFPATETLKSIHKNYDLETLNV